LGFREASAGRTSPSERASRPGSSARKSCCTGRACAAVFTTGKGVVDLDDGTKIISRVSVCATGVEYRRLGLPNEDKVFGAGAYYGAGASEAALFGNEEVVIVGAGNSSTHASLHLARYARKVTIVMRGERLNDSVSEYLVDRIKNTPNIEVVPNTEFKALHGAHTLEAATLKNRLTGEERTVKTSFLFLCLGGVPNTEWAIEVGVFFNVGAGPITTDYTLPGSSF
jgi:thioredoxin reductase (NADPH)